MRRLPAQFSTNAIRGVFRVVRLEDLSHQWEPGLQLAVLIRSNEDREKTDHLISSGLTISWVDSDALEIGDIVVPESTKTRALVLFRESDTHHSLLMTNQCNSYCLMCSQPPTPQDDAWLVDEAMEVIRHIRTAPRILGLSGGEPLLLGTGLRTVLDTISLHHPETLTEVLTNGRLLGDAAYAEKLLTGLTSKTTWLVPLYGHADFVHDFVVQTPGAFDETIGGLLALQEYQQPVQLRIVLIEPVLKILPELCGFIGRNLPFVKEVALMGCEPIGFALANKEQCSVDLADWTEVLQLSAHTLQRYQIAYLLMNTPLCALPEPFWSKAHKSISDWKNVYTEECDKCSVKQQCSGLFAWHERGWKPTKIRAIQGVPP